MENENKMQVHFSITNYGESHSYNAIIDDCTPWSEVLDKIARTLEASYGYTFDLEELGIYYRGKDNER